MSAPNIIRHYVIRDDGNKAKDKEASPPRIIKSQQAETDSTRKIETEKARANLQPRIELRKDDHGILTAIDVTCSCGQTFTIRLEYE